MGIPSAPAWPRHGPCAAAPVTETTETRAVVTREGPGEPILLTLYRAVVEVTVELLPKRALTLALELHFRPAAGWWPRGRRALDPCRLLTCDRETAAASCLPRSGHRRSPTAMIRCFGSTQVGKPALSGLSSRKTH